MVQTAAQHFITVNDAQVAAFEVTSAAEFFLYRAAYFFALVLVAGFEFVADFFALEIFDSVNFFLAHHLPKLIDRIIQLVARDGHLRLPTPTLNHDRCLAQHTAIIVALLNARVAAARKELFAGGAANRYRLHTRFALAAKQLFDLLVTAGAKLDSGWVSLTRLARTLVAYLFALMMTAVKLSVAYTIAGKWLGSTDDNLLLAVAVALLLSFDRARSARSIVTVVFALVLKAVQQFATFVLTRKFAPFGKLASDGLALLTAVAGNIDRHIARWTGTWMAKDLARLMSARRILFAFAVLVARMR